MMPSEYDHASYIYRPRAFALALGSMLADQFGIRGGEVQVDARIADLHASSRRGSQTIFHGPVVYEQDRFTRFTSPRNEFEAFLGKIFIKDKCLEAEREYLFAIWSEDELAEDHVDFRISLAMREAMLPLITPSRETYQETDPPDSSAPDVPQVPRDLPALPCEKHSLTRIVPCRTYGRPPTVSRHATTKYTIGALGENVAPRPLVRTSWRWSKLLNKDGCHHRR